MNFVVALRGFSNTVMCGFCTTKQAIDKINFLLLEDFGLYLWPTISYSRPWHYLRVVQKKVPISNPVASRITFQTKAEQLSLTELKTPQCFSIFILQDFIGFDVVYKIRQLVNYVIFLTNFPKKLTKSIISSN